MSPPSPERPVVEVPASVEPLVPGLGFSPLGGEVSSEEEEEVGTMAGVVGVFLGGIARAKKNPKLFFVPGVTRGSPIKGQLF